MRITPEEEASAERMRAEARRFGAVEVPSEFLLRLLEAADLRVYGRCRHCRAEVPPDCNCCAPCADERGP